MPRLRIAKSLAQDVLAELRADILSGRLAPGTRLKMNDLTASLDVSLTVLREVLNRLTEQGLVTLEPQVGFRVMSLSGEDLQDLTAARVQIECAALRESIRLGDHAWEGALLAAHHVLSRTRMSLPDDPDRIDPTWARAHQAFHEALISACGSARLVGIAAGLRDAAELYRQWSVPAGRERGRDVAAEHQDLLDAALDREGDLCARLLAEHISRTSHLLLAAMTDEKGAPGLMPA